MPLSGTYVKLGYNEFLLYNNSRYGSDGRWDYLFPVKVKLNKIFPGAAPEDAIQHFVHAGQGFPIDGRHATAFVQNDHIVDIHRSEIYWFLGAKIHPLRADT